MRTQLRSDLPLRHGITFRRLLLLVGAATLLLGFVMPIFLTMRRMLNQTPTELRSLARLAERSHLELPAGARLLDGINCDCWNPYLYARVALPPGSVAAFLKQPLFGGEQSRFEKAAEIFISGIAPPRGWNLAAIRRFKAAGGGELQQGGITQVVVDMDRPLQPVVYIHWYNG